MDKPFKGLKVLELTTYVAAPCAARLLADMGAEVIKVERPVGDNWRSGGINFRPDEFSQDENPIYDFYNAGKKHIVLDLKNEDGLKIFKKLLKKADIFVTSTRLGGLKRLGIDYDSVKDENPRLIYAMVEGYGEKGKDADTAAFDITAFWARCGMMVDLAVIDPDTEAYQPIYPPSSVGDTSTAFLLFSEINAALYTREKTGKGQIVRSGLFHTGIFSFATMQAICQRPYGKVYPKIRYDHYGAMKGTYVCRDGQYLFFYPWDFVQVANILGHPELISDPRFDTPQKREENRKELSAEFVRIFKEKDRAEWLDILRPTGITHAPANHFADISEDEQAIANGYIEDVTYPNGKTLKVASSPLSMSSLDGTDMKTHPAPHVGADTFDVLKDLGYSDEEIKLYFENGAATSKHDSSLSYEEIKARYDNKK